MSSSSSHSHSWSEIPAEVLISILEKIDNKKKVLECQLVCKAWKKPAERVGYQTITVSRYKPNFQKLVETLLSTPHLGKLITRVHFNAVFPIGEGPWDPDNFFNHLSCVCPNIRVITTMYSCPSLWLRFIMDQTRWKKLAVIPEPNSAGDVQLYTTTALVYKDQFTSLNISQLSGKPIQIQREQHKLLSNLTKFKRLTHLKLSKGQNLSLHQLEPVINDCPTLTNLIIRFTTCKDDIVPNTNRSSEIIEEIKQLKPKTTVKKLFLEETVNDGDETLFYIMHVFPNLNFLYYNHGMNLVSTDQTINCFSPTILKSFLQFALNLPEVALKQLHCEEIGSALSDYWQSKEYREKNREASVDIFCRTFHDDFPHKTYLDLIHITKLKITCHELTGKSSPPEIIKDIGPHLKHLKYDAKQFYQPEEDKDIKNMYHGYIIDIIFTHCRSLKTLECSFNCLQSCNPILAVNGSLQKLTISRSNLNNQVLNQLSMRLPILNELKLIKNTFIKYDRTPLKGKKISINMPYTSFKLLYIEEVPRKQYEQVCLKISTKEGNEYFTAKLIAPIVLFEKCSKKHYVDQLNIKSCFIIDIRCEMLFIFTFKFGEHLIEKLIIN